MIAFVRWISRAYRPWPNKLAQSSPEWMWRGCFVLVAIVAGGVAASGAGANSFGGLAERTYREAIYQPIRESIDVRVIDPLPYLVAIRAAWQVDVVSLRRQFLVLASSAPSMDDVTNIDTLTNIDMLTT